MSMVVCGLLLAIDRVAMWRLGIGAVHHARVGALTWPGGPGPWLAWTDHLTAKGYEIWIAHSRSNNADYDGTGDHQ